MSSISFKNHAVKLKYWLTLLEENAELSEERKISAKQWLRIKLLFGWFLGLHHDAFQSDYQDFLICL